VQVLVVLVPVFFGFMGFAIDLGRLYLVRGELQSAANAMALAAAARLIGTDVSFEQANAAAQLAIAGDEYGNKYDFGKVVIGSGTGLLVSATPEPTFYDSVAAAAETGEGGTEAGTSTARFVRVDITADAPLVFWGLLSLGQDRKTPIAARAVAGISAPLCTVCGIEPLAVAAIDLEDSTGNFGFTFDTRYTLGYMCNGTPAPSVLQGSERRLPYLLVNRLNAEATLFAEESSQAYRIGAGGLPGSTTQATSCMTVGAAEEMWVSAAPLQCSANRVPEVARAFTCGLVTRFEPAVPEACEQIADVGTIASAFTPDTADPIDTETWSAYTGNLRRVITIPIVESLAAGGTMNVLGFRQFLVQPDAGTSKINETDVNGRFIVTYLGSPVPVRQGTFGGCTVSQGPGKVVLHR
jgi:Flp pilus assembly protein TadG